MNSRYLVMAMLLCSPMGARGELSSGGGRPDIFSGLYENGSFQSLTFVNSVVGWDTFFNAGFVGSGRVIGNVEAGLVWDGHEVFLRPPGSLPAVGLTSVGTGALGEVDFHATMVGHVLAGSGHVPGSDPADYYLYALGMAPLAQIWSGAIATEFSPADTGAFSTTTNSTISVYREFFQGVGNVKPDAINSSWGGLDLQSPEMLAVEGLAVQNPTVALVVSAGNGGNATISAPGSTFNSITVGSLGGSNFLEPSSFSARGAADFYNPVSGETLEGVRAAVDIAAHGELLFLAAYLGPTGSLGASTDPLIVDLVTDPSPTDLSWVNQSGTSFSSPIVAGGIALLKDAAENDIFFNLLGVASATDTRVIKSVLMAGATETVGWDNGQFVNVDGKILTTQALDAATGAGALNLDRAVETYLLSETRDIEGSVGGSISATGWDFASLSRPVLGSPTPSNDYLFANPFDTPIELTASLNWFAGYVFEDTEGIGENLSFSDLNLQIWTVVNEVLTTLVAESASIYNNTEFLRVNLEAGSYALRITFNGIVFETVPNSVTAEQYGLAWHVIPEPTSIFLLMLSCAVLILKARKIPVGKHRRSAT